LGLTELEVSRALICVRVTGVGPVAVCAQSPRVGADVPGLDALACCWSPVACALFLSHRDAAAIVLATSRPPAPCRRPLSVLSRRLAVCGVVRTSPYGAELVQSGVSCYRAHLPLGLDMSGQTHPSPPCSSVSWVSARRVCARPCVAASWSVATMRATPSSDCPARLGGTPLSAAEMTSALTLRSRSLAVGSARRVQRGGATLAKFTLHAASQDCASAARPHPAPIRPLPSPNFGVFLSTVPLRPGPPFACAAPSLTTVCRLAGTDSSD
jgi:hypothetical protein